MVKPITIRIDEVLWVRFKKQTKAKGLILQAALEDLLRAATNPKTISATDDNQGQGW